MNWENSNFSELTARLPGENENTAWLKTMRTEQWQRFLENGWPTRVNEAWKYTDINVQAQQQLTDLHGIVSTQAEEVSHVAPLPLDLPLTSVAPLNPAVPPTSVAPSTPAVPLTSVAPSTPAVPLTLITPLTTIALEQLVINLTFINGELQNKPEDLPDGIVVTDLKTALLTHPEWVERGLSEHQNTQAGFVNFNTSLWQNGLFVLIPDDVTFDKPIIVDYVTDNTVSQTSVLRNMIFLGKNSQLTLCQNYNSAATTPYWHLAINQINLADQAKLTHVKCQNEGQGATHLCENLVRQATESVLNVNHFSLGAKLQREAWHIDLAGPRAQCQCRGLAIINASQHSDYHLTIDHQAPQCSSEQIFRAIATDKSRAIFNGKVIVQPEGQQAVADQLSQNLLLSSSAEIDTRPELEIYADDVKCSHGASVGQLDPDALFYLKSRGISHDLAIDMLLQAFVEGQFTGTLPFIQKMVTPILQAKLAVINGVNSL